MINILNKNKAYITSSGFTLAEVLITLGIIGIVAALTLPIVVTKYKQFVAINKIKKMYSMISQSLLYAFPDRDITSIPIQDGNTQSTENWFNTIIKPYIKTTKICIDKAGCWNKSTKTLNNQEPRWNKNGIGIGANIVVFTTIDSYAINFEIDTAGMARQLYGINLKSPFDNILVIFIDINSQSYPNIIGKDIFVMGFTSDRGLIPAGHDKTDAEINSNCSKNGTGYYCLEKIIRNGWEIDKDNLW